MPGLRNNSEGIALNKTYSKRDIEELFKNLDKKLEEEVEIVAIGGTALSLTGNRSFSKDIDFCYSKCKFPSDFAQTAVDAGKEIGINKKDIEMFSGFEMTLLELPEFGERAIPYKGLSLRHIKLKTMHPFDIILSKIYRGEPKDMQDVENLVNDGQINLNQLKTRFIEVAKSQKDWDVRREFMKKYNDFIENYTPSKTNQPH